MLSLKACVCLLVLYRTRAVMCVIIYAIKETVVLSNACTHKYVLHILHGAKDVSMHSSTTSWLSSVVLLLFLLFHTLNSVLLLLELCRKWCATEGFSFFSMFCDATAIAFRFGYFNLQRG